VAIGEPAMAQGQPAAAPRQPIAPSRQLATINPAVSCNNGNVRNNSFREANGDAGSDGGQTMRAKKYKGSKCFRCDGPGHNLNDCTAVLCDICWSPDHLSNVYPILSAPKPTMQMYGFAYENLMFFETPMTGSIRPRVENTRMSRVTIDDGTTIPEIISQLQWVVPDDQYQWNIRQVEDKFLSGEFPK
jgi:hypothetical protein